MALSCSLCFGLATLISIITAVPVNRQVGLSSNVYMDLRNDTKGQGPESVCMIDDVLYQDGDTVPTASPCEVCVCRPPGFACTLVTCEAKPGCRALQRSNQCCPEYRCECERNGRVYQNGEKLENPDTPCEVCYCQSGEVVCTVIECYKRDDCEARYVSGRCCPKYDHCPPIDFHPERPAPVSFRPLSSSAHPVETLHNVTSSVTYSTTEFSILDTTVSVDHASDYPKTEISKLTTSSETSVEYSTAIMLGDEGTMQDTTIEVTEHRDISTEGSTEHVTEELNTTQEIVLADEPYDNEINVVSTTIGEQVVNESEEDVSTEIEQTTQIYDNSNENVETTTDSLVPQNESYDTQSDTLKETVLPEEFSERTTLDTETDNKQTEDDSKKDSVAISTISSSTMNPMENSDIENISESDINSIESSENDENTTDISLRNMPLSDSSKPDLSNEINDQNEIGSGWNQSSEVEDLPDVSTSHNKIKNTEPIMHVQGDQNMKTDSGSGALDSSSEESTEGSGFEPSTQNNHENVIFNPSTPDIYEGSGFDSSTYFSRDTFPNPSAIADVNEGSGFDSSTHDSYDGSGFFNTYIGDSNELSTTERIWKDEISQKNSISATADSILNFTPESSMKEFTSASSLNNNDNSFQNTRSTTQNIIHINNVMKEYIDDDNFSGDGILADDSRLTEVYSERVTDHANVYDITTDTTANIIQRNALSNSETFAEATNREGTASDDLKYTTIIFTDDVDTSELASTVTIQEEPYNSKFSDMKNAVSEKFDLLKTNNSNQTKEISILSEDISTYNPEVTTASLELKILPDINKLKPNKVNNNGKNESDHTEMALPEEWLKQNEQISERYEDNTSTTDLNNRMTGYTAEERSVTEEITMLRDETTTNSNEDSTHVQVRMGLGDIDDKVDIISETSDIMPEVTKTEESLATTDMAQKFQESDLFKTPLNDNEEKVETTTWIITSSKDGYTESEKFIPDEKYIELLSTIMPTTDFLLLKGSNENLNDELLQNDSQNYYSDPTQQSDRTTATYSITTASEKVSDITKEKTQQEEDTTDITTKIDLPEVSEQSTYEDSLKYNKTESNAVKQFLPNKVKTSAEVNFYTTSTSEISDPDNQQQISYETSVSNIKTEDSTTSETVPDSSKDNSLVNLEREDTEKIVALLQTLFRNTSRDA